MGNSIKGLERLIEVVTNPTGLSIFNGRKAVKFIEEVSYCQELIKKYEKDNKVTFVVYDTETTGLGKPEDFYTGVHGTTEIAGLKVELNTKTGEVSYLGNHLIQEEGEYKQDDSENINEYQSFVNAGITIPIEASEVTGIYNETIKDAPKEDIVIKEFLEFAKGSILVGHNIGDKFNQKGFDNYIVMNPLCQRYEISDEDLRERSIDTLPLFRSITEKVMSDYTNTSLCQWLETPLVGAHRAIYDVRGNALAFVKLIEVIWMLDVQELKELTKDLDDGYLVSVDCEEYNDVKFLILTMCMDEQYKVNNKKHYTKIIYLPEIDEFIWEDSHFPTLNIDDVWSKDELKRRVTVLLKEQNFTKAINDYLNTLWF